MYLVGGAVRDLLLAGGEDAPVESPGTSTPAEPQERDFVVCGMPIDDLMSKLAEFGKCDFVGKSFGVIKFRPYKSCEFLGWKFKKRETCDIALPRVERSTGVHHRDFEVEYDPAIPIEDDLKRRDFTINAIAMKPDGTIIDPTDGRADLSKRLIRLVFKNSFEEDPLRILRAARFAAKLKFDLDPALVKSARGVPVGDLSPERVREELDKALIATPNPSLFFRNLHNMKELLRFFPEMLHTIKHMNLLCAALERTRGVHRRWALYLFLDREDGEITWYSRYISGKNKLSSPAEVREYVSLTAIEEDAQSIKPPPSKAAVLFNRLRYSSIQIAHAAAVSRLSKNVIESLICEFQHQTTQPVIRSTLKAVVKASIKPISFNRFCRDFFGAMAETVIDDWKAGAADVGAFIANPPITGKRLIRMGFPQGAAIGIILQEVSYAHDRGEINSPIEAEMFVMERFGHLRS